MHQLPTALLESIRQIATHEQLGDTETSIDASVYTSAEHFEHERASIFRKVPMPILPSASLSKGMAVSHRLDDVPIIVTRTKEGEAKAFVNVCRHRGTKLLDAAEPVKVARIVCPYHAWSYDLDGALTGLPLPDTFPSVRKTEYGLIPLRCIEAGGIIWVGFEGVTDEEAAIVTDFLGPEMDGMGLAHLQLFRKKIYTVSGNWKLIMDAFHENYHVKRLHANTLARFFRDDVSLTFPIGPHQRTLMPRDGFTPSDVTDNMTIEDLSAKVSFGYTLFPTGMVIGSPKYISILILNPTAVGQTLVDYYMLVPPHLLAEDNDLYERSFALMDRAFGEEDLRAAEIGQEGLEAGYLDRVLLGGMEQRIRVFHDAVEKYTGRDDAGTAEIAPRVT